MATQLIDTPFKGKDDIFSSSMNKWVVFLDRMKLSEGDIDPAECAACMESLDVGYQFLNVKMQTSSLNKYVLNLVDKITLKGNATMYIQPVDFKRQLSTNGVTSNMEYA